MNDDTPTEAAQPASRRAEPAGLDSEAVGWAWAQPIVNNPGARIVLMCLAGRVDESWECIASHEEVAVDAMVPARSMRRYLEQLEEGGFIARLKRLDEKGLRLPSVFRLNPRSEPTAILATGSDQQECPTAVGGEVQRPIWPVDGRRPSSDPVANMAGGQDTPEMADPTANMAGGPDLGERPTADMAGGQEGLWQDPSDEQTGRSGPTANMAAGESRTIESSSSKKKNKKQNLSSSGIREDVEQLCSRLLSWLIKKDYRQRPDSVSEAWRTEARLLLDKDRIDLQEALEVLDWSQRDHFWHKNIHSLPKFREKYGDLEVKSRDQRGSNSGSAARPVQGNGSGSQVPPRGTRRQNPFGSKRETA